MREAVHFWGDPVRALLMEAHPDSDTFDEVVPALTRSAPREHPYLASADVQSVVAELGLTVGQFARVVGVPPAYAYGVGVEWDGTVLVRESVEHDPYRFVELIGIVVTTRRTR